MQDFLHKFPFSPLWFKHFHRQKIFEALAWQKLWLSKIWQGTPGPSGGLVTSIAGRCFPHLTTCWEYVSYWLVAMCKFRYLSCHVSTLTCVNQRDCIPDLASTSWHTGELVALTLWLGSRTFCRHDSSILVILAPLLNPLLKNTCLLCLKKLNRKSISDSENY